MRDLFWRTAALVYLVLNRVKGKHSSSGNQPIMTFFNREMNFRGGPLYGNSWTESYNRSGLIKLILEGKLSFGDHILHRENGTKIKASYGIFSNVSYHCARWTCERIITKTKMGSKSIDLFPILTRTDP